MRILYDSKKLKYKSPFGCLCEGQKCTINIDIPSSCDTLDVFLDLQNEHTGQTLRFPFTLKETNGIYDTFSCVFSIDTIGLYFYNFFIHTKESDFPLFKEGHGGTNIGSGDRWQLSCYAKDFTVPESFQGKIMYQIFPDRFNKEGECDLSDKLKPFYIHKDTNEIPFFEPNEQGKVLNNDFYGGNLKGIEAKLSYIKDLGVSVIYLNPIFKAYSNHRYDTCDYKKIDPMLGSEDDFINFCKKAHEFGIKIILDGVFSHTGSSSIYFDKEHIFGGGAVSNPDSPYKSWYNFTEYPCKYDSWWGIETLPAVNEMNDGFLDYIIRNDDSVISHWMRLGADGFRLDVADELPDEFIYLLRKKVKEINPDSFVLGEVWEDASNKISYGKRRKYFVGSELDSVMNYVYKNAIISYACSHITGKEFANEIMTIAENYPPMCVNSLMNCLSTHDTARIINSLSFCEFPNSKKEMSQKRLTETEYRDAVERLFLAIFLQYTLPGMPCIYYGDEIGMQGFGDPFCRGYFSWDKTDDGILSFYKALGKIKNKYVSLKKGDIEFISNGDVLIFKRRFQNEEFTAIINMGDESFVTENKDIVISHMVSYADEKIYINKGGFAGIIQKRM